MKIEKERSEGAFYASGTGDARGYLEEAALCFKKHLQQHLRKPTLFVMACNEADDVDVRRYGLIRENLLSFARRNSVAFVDTALTPKEAGIASWNRFPESAVFRCLALDLGASEQIRDLLKDTLWKTTAATASTERGLRPGSLKDRVQQLAWVLCEETQGNAEEKPSAKERFRLRRHGLFVPAITRAHKDIRTHAFAHGGGQFYRYRVVSKKMEAIPPQLGALKDYLDSLFTDCPNHFFNGHPRISGMRWPFTPSCRVIKDHDMSRHARNALRQPRYRSPHDSVEIHLLEQDPGAVACEIPLWLEPAELKQFASLFSRTKPLTGHIDILRIENGKIQIWDYKSNAAMSAHGGTQVFLYAVGLSIRTGIPLGNFACGYFDREKAFVFSPADPFAAYEDR